MTALEKVMKDRSSSDRSDDRVTLREVPVRMLIGIPDRSGGGSNQGGGDGQRQHEFLCRIHETKLPSLGIAQPREG